MTESQQIFALFFAVFFGVLMSTLPPRSFPTDKLFTSSWKRAWYRLMLSIVFVNLLPAVQFMLIYGKLHEYKAIEFEPMTAAARVLTLPAAALGLFAFNRWYFASLVFSGARAFPHDDENGDSVIGHEESGVQHLLGSLPYLVFLVLPWLV